jgi:aryl-alcohol dehydrogenase-like predicted oxidoreductase
MEQLKENIDAFDTVAVTLSDETLAAVDAVHMSSRDPCMQVMVGSCRLTPG